MKKTKIILGVLVTIFSLAAFGTSRPAMAVTCPEGSKQSTASSLALCNTDYGTSSEAETAVTSRVNRIINVAIGIIGLLAVIMIIVSGFQMTTSAGNPAKVAKAKNTLTYAVIGLVIALLAYAIVNFVLASVFNMSV